MFDLPEVSPSTVEFIKSAAEEISFEKLSAAQIRQRREAGKSRRRGRKAERQADKAAFKTWQGKNRGGRASRPRGGTPAARYLRRQERIANGIGLGLTAVAAAGVYARSSGAIKTAEVKPNLQGHTGRMHYSRVGAAGKINGKRTVIINNGGRVAAKNAKSTVKREAQAARNWEESQGLKAAKRPGRGRRVVDVSSRPAVRIRGELANPARRG